MSFEWFFALCLLDRTVSTTIYQDLVNTKKLIQTEVLKVLPFLRRLSFLVRQMALLPEKLLVFQPNASVFCFRFVRFCVA
jgi:hypothetical protein